LAKLPGHQLDGGVGGAIRAGGLLPLKKRRWETVQVAVAKRGKATTAAKLEREKREKRRDNLKTHSSLASSRKLPERLHRRHFSVSFKVPSGREKYSFAERERAKKSSRRRRQEDGRPRSILLSSRWSNFRHRRSTVPLVRWEEQAKGAQVKSWAS